MVETLSVADAIATAAGLVGSVLDTAVARLSGTPQPGTGPVAGLLAQLVSDDPSPLPDESRAVAIACGVERRAVAGLAEAPGLPQSLIRHLAERHAPARAKTLPKHPIWRLAAILAGAATGAALRSERADAWLRATVLLTEGRRSIDLHAPRTLWTLVASEMSTLPWCDVAGSDRLRGIAMVLADEAPPIDFAARFLCWSYEGACRLTLASVAEFLPPGAMPLAGGPGDRIGWAGFSPDMVPKDFGPLIFPQRPDSAA